MGSLVDRIKLSQKRPVTRQPHMPYTRLGSASGQLRQALEALYWEGVAQEIRSVVAMLKKWEEPDFCQILPQENAVIDGFDTFIRQVIPKTTVTPGDVNRAKSHSRPKYEHLSGEHESYVQSIHQSLMEAARERTRTKVNVAVYKRLAERPASETTLIQRRARLLLQACGFLDIEKIIEHRPNDGRSSSLAASPQLKVDRILDCGCPVLVDVRCFECARTIHGSSFRHKEDRKELVICEDCYWQHHYGDRSYRKQYKSSVPPAGSTAGLCKKQHRGSRSLSAYQLPWRHYYSVVDAKYSSISIARNRLTSWKTSLSTLERTTYPKFIQKYFPPPHVQFPHGVTDEFIVGKPKGKDPTKDIHMALRIGPLLIENGTSPHDGALISLRTPTFQRVISDEPQGSPRCLAVSRGSGGGVWSGVWPFTPRPRRVQAVLKQIIGMPFSGSTLRNLEGEIINIVVDASRTEGLKSEHFLEDIHRILKSLLSPWVSRYLDSITDRLLLQSSVELGGNDTQNSCLQFCDSCLDWGLFGPISPEPRIRLPDGSVEPLYCMSFVCRPGSFPDAPFTKQDSQQDVPYGLTEEYLRRFWHGGHDGSDLIDWLQEYWYDWAGFEKPPYPHQDLFPWDCTEAVGRYPVRCGDCTLAKHLWAFPFDSWSIVALHLLRGEPLYPAEHSRSGIAAFDEKDWIQNRIMLLSALDVLMAGARAMASEPQFRRATAWLHRQNNAKTSRVKLGGIHRAQPFSHATELRSHATHLSAHWIWERNPADKLTAYEKDREKRYLHPTLFVSNSAGNAPAHKQMSTIYSPPTTAFRLSSKADNGVCGTQRFAEGCAVNGTDTCFPCNNWKDSAGCGGGFS